MLLEEFIIWRDYWTDENVVNVSGNQKWRSRGFKPVLSDVKCWIFELFPKIWMSELFHNCVVLLPLLYSTFRLTQSYYSYILHFVLATKAPSFVVDYVNVNVIRKGMAVRNFLAISLVVITSFLWKLVNKLIWCEVIIFTLP